MDPETTKKRKKSRLRSANWTVSQTSLLLRLLKKKQQRLGEENLDSDVWEQIAVALNKKSRPQRKGEQLKMRLKTIRSEFNDYRTCVEKPGWGWDSRRKIPIAPSATCWDEAIKLNKKLSKCRTKPFPWYKQVAEICGADVPVGENEPSGSTNDIMEEDNLPLVVSSPGAGTEQSAGPNSADDMSSSSGKRTRDELVVVELEEEFQNNDAKEGLPEAGIKETKSRTRNANWTDHQTSVLVDLLLEQHELGITEYTQDFWKQLCNVLNEKTQPGRTAKELWLRLKRLKSDFSDYKFCAEMQGWNWDNEKSLPVAPNEACWDEIIKINNKYHRCRTRPFWWYEQVAKLCIKNPETEHHKLSQRPNWTVKEASNPLLLPLNSEAYTDQSNNSAGATPISAGIDSGRHTQARERNPDRMQQTPKEMEQPNKRLQLLAELSPSVYKDASSNYKLVAKKLVKVRSQFKLSRSDFIDMSFVVRDELNRELFMEQEGRELLDWIMDSLETYREQRKAQQAVQQSGNRPLFMPVYPYPPSGPYTPPPQM